MLAYHAAFLLLFVGTSALFAGLDLVNLRYAARTLRAESAWVTAELGADVERLIEYQRAGTGLSLLRSWTTVLLTLLVLYGGVYADAVRAVESLGLGGVASGVAFLVGLVVVSRVVALPFSAVDAFVVEELFGFNARSPRLWLRDTAVSLALTLVLTALVGWAVLAVVAAFPAWWWVAATGLFVAFALVMQVVYPRVIAPLFYDFDPVEGGDLRAAVDGVFDRAGFDCEQVYVMDASTRSTKSNAYFVGFGRTKRVVLFDTLVEQLSIPELQSVLAHELAHWKRGHVWKGLAASTVEMAVVLFLFQTLLSTSWLYAMFGVPEATYAGLVLAAVWAGPLSRLVAPLTNRLSLAHEREADDFAARVMGDGDPLAGALATLVSENLGNPFPHPWYAAFHSSHPPVPERIRRIRGGESPAASRGEEVGA